MTDWSVNNGCTHRDRPAKTGMILRAATQVFAEQGYQAATMDAIAERAGIGKGTLYEYFRDKQDLFFAVFNDYIASMARLARQSVGIPSASAAAQIQQAIHTVLAMSAEARDLFPLVFEFWSASASPNRQERVATMFRDTYAEVPDAGRRPDSERPASRRIRPPRRRYTDRRGAGGRAGRAVPPGLVRSRLDPVSMGDDFVAVLLRGLAAPAKPQPESPLPKTFPKRGVQEMKCALALAQLCPVFARSRRFRRKDPMP